MADGGKKEEQKEQPISQTQTVTIKKSPNVVLKLRASDVASGRRVQWDQTAVDNEYMNKKKSKCCCIYTKPKAFDESGSDSDDDDDGHCTHHCRGHLPKDFKHLPTVEEPEPQLPNGEVQDPNSKKDDSPDSDKKSATGPS